MKVVVSYQVKWINFEVELSHNRTSSCGSEKKTLEVDNILLVQRSAEVTDVRLVKKSLVEQTFLDLRLFLLWRREQLRFSTLGLLVHSHDLGDCCQNICLANEALERLNCFADQLSLIFEEAFLLLDLKLDRAKQLRVGFPLRVLHQGGEKVESGQVFGRAHGNLVVLENVLAKLDLLVCFVASADNVSIQKLMGLDVSVDIYEMQKV